MVWMKLMTGLASVVTQQSDPAATPADGTDAASATAPAATEVSRSLLDYVHAGGMLSYVLVCVSLVAVTLAIRNLMLLRRANVLPPEDAHRLDVLLREGDVKGAIAYCDRAENESSLTRIMGSALKRCARSNFGLLEIRTALEEAGQKELDRLYRLTDGLGVIAAIGPMMGLLGTVVGMIGAFATLGSLEGSARSQQLSGYMSIALVTTAEGLIIAIPCTLAYSLMRRHIDRLLGEVGEVVEDFAQTLQAGADREPVAAAPGARPPQRSAVPPASRPMSATGGSAS